MEPRNCTVLYKILTPTEKANLCSEDWKGTELDLKDGFIHLSSSEQIPGTLDRFFSRESQVGDDIVIMTLPRSNIDETKLKFDPAAGTEFGHIYGTINPSTDFTETTHVKRDAHTGKFHLDKLQF
ncbi:hypothetical protein CBS101457_006495 [Exobasidium rhododendri]|nr:hypothetical protein CBS101457_006495 [Exobasidium rhododendri]